MAKGLYNYLEEKKIFIDAPLKYLNRIEKNIDEIPTIGDKADLRIKIKELSPTTIVRDKKYPFARTSIDDSREYLAVDFFRYANKTQSILMPSEDEFIVESYLPEDESGTTKIIKKWYFKQDSAKNKALFHASLVNVGMDGILISGKSLSGKTSLTLSFLENASAKLVSEENTLVQKLEDHLFGFYLPRPIHIRLKLVYESEKLSQIINNFSIVEATQNVDDDYIKRLIQSKTFDLDSNVDIARKNFAGLLGIETKSKSNIKKIIFPEYSSSKKIKIKKLNSYHAYSLLRENEILKNSDIGHLKKAYEVEHLSNSLAQRDWINKISCFKLYFSDYKHLNKTIIEDLLS